MRRTLTILTSACLFAALLTVTLPAFAATVTVDNTGAAGDCSGNFAYAPTQTQIAVGDSVTFTNPAQFHNNGCASAEHPTQCIGSQSNGKCPWQTNDLDSGQSFTVTFPAEGTFKYRCVAHPYMIGTITVGDGDPSEPEPEPTADPTTPPPSPTAKPSPTAPPPSPTAAPSPTSAPTAPDAPASQAPSDEPSASAEPTAPDEPIADPTVEDTPAQDPTDTAVGSGDEGDGDGSGVDTIPASSGGGTKAVATVLLLVTAGAVWSVRRGG